MSCGGGVLCYYNRHVDKFYGELRDPGGKISISEEAVASGWRYYADRHFCVAVSAAGQ